MEKVIIYFLKLAKEKALKLNEKLTLNFVSLFEITLYWPYKSKFFLDIFDRTNSTFKQNWIKFLQAGFKDLQKLSYAIYRNFP